MLTVHGLRYEGKPSVCASVWRPFYIKHKGRVPVKNDRTIQVYTDPPDLPQVCGHPISPFTQEHFLHIANVLPEDL